MVYVRAYRWAWWEFYLTYRAYWYAARKFNFLNAKFRKALKDLEALRDSDASLKEIATAEMTMKQANAARTLWWRTVFNDKRQTAATARTLLWRIASQRPVAHKGENGEVEKQEDETPGAEKLKDLDESQVVENPAAELGDLSNEDDNVQPDFDDGADDELCNPDMEVCDLGEDEGVQPDQDDTGDDLK